MHFYASTDNFDLHKNTFDPFSADFPVSREEYVRNMEDLCKIGYLPHRSQLNFEVHVMNIGMKLFSLIQSSKARDRLDNFPFIVLNREKTLFEII